VAGFQGKDKDGRWTTLGRGGSDTTAIALAAAISADRCDIYTDVDGIYSADPHLCSNAYKLDAISYKDMLEMAVNGAQVLNTRSVEIAMKNAVSVRVRSTFTPADQGTLVTRYAKQLNWFTGIAIAKEKACVKIRLTPPALNDRHAQKAFRRERVKTKSVLHACLARAGISHEVGRSLKNSGFELSLCVTEQDVSRVLEIFEDAQTCLNLKSVRVEKDLRKVTIVSSELASSHEVDAILQLTQMRIPISIVISAPHSLSMLIPSDKSEEALQLLHGNVCLLKLVS
jgi:aspartate kinase